MGNAPTILRSVLSALCTLTVILPATAQERLAGQGSDLVQPPTATVHDSASSSAAIGTEPASIKPATTAATSSPDQSSGSATELRPAVPPQESSLSSSVVQHSKKRERSDLESACKMARYHWLDKAAEADPSLVEAICNHYTAARILAKHPRLGEIAKYDHYTCRRLTRWRSVARILAANGECQKVVAYDPEGIYRAIKRERRLAKLLSKNPMFDQMISDNPDLGRLISLYI